ncbi:GDSL-type esterase/lipase family protein [Cohnella thailandensis]|uniref:G-D-S-L family lipolytic protein n=1 Tax=Cohnella thailandensis TaxID=557557 RepID=A0A841T080_9BACL|nr:GDSL-type esterase/lipase family protein [Cohnella thailandensis]MBB6634451.1 G-D-S-L family lipolytic protein [Cohnella thailandensis]MBP1972995.1 lysophospholipase L1-like esterase [Cohnella thailandensis]
MAKQSDTINTAAIPVSKLEEDSYDWWERHEQVLGMQAGIDPEIVMIGDSITHFWGGEPKPPHLHGSGEVWNSLFSSYRVLNMGFGWDRTQNVLWRLDHGQLDGLNPKLVVILIGTNNTSETENARANTAEEIAEGLAAICDRVEAKAPNARIVVMAVFPREKEPDHPRRLLIQEINARYAKLAEERGYAFVDIGPELLEADGTLSPETTPDYCHLTDRGYRKWAEALKPYLAEVAN